MNTWFRSQAERDLEIVSITAAACDWIQSGVISTPGRPRAVSVSASIASSLACSPRYVVA